MYLGEGGTEPEMTRDDGIGGDSADEAANAARLALIASHGKPQRERELLRAIYNAGEYASVEHGDSPDFLLRRHHVNSRFGVEVTEVFDSDADARLRFHPDYVTSLLAGVSRQMPTHVLCPDPVPEMRAGGLRNRDRSHSRNAALVRRQPSGPHERPVTRSRGFRCSTRPTAARMPKPRAVGREAMSGTHRGAC